MHTFICSCMYSVGMNHEIRTGHVYTETDVYCISTVRQPNDQCVSYIIYNKQTTGLNKGYCHVDIVSREIDSVQNVEGVRG